MAIVKNVGQPAVNLVSDFDDAEMNLQIKDKFIFFAGGS